MSYNGTFSMDIYNINHDVLGQGTTATPSTSVEFSATASCYPCFRPMGDCIDTGHLVSSLLDGEFRYLKDVDTVYFAWRKHQGKQQTAGVGHHLRDVDAAEHLYVTSLAAGSEQPPTERLTHGWRTYHLCPTHPPKVPFPPPSESNHEFEVVEKIPPRANGEELLSYLSRAQASIVHPAQHSVMRNDVPGLEPAPPGVVSLEPAMNPSLPQRQAWMYIVTRCPPNREHLLGLWHRQWGELAEIMKLPPQGLAGSGWHARRMATVAAAEEFWCGEGWAKPMPEH